MSKFQENVILAIDDEPANLRIVVDYLEVFGFDIRVAQSGEQGIERALHIRPELILLDVMLPGLDGFDTCRRLKADERTQNIPVIFMTALADVDDKVRGFAAGGVDYITKPIQQAELSARIQTQLKLFRLQNDLEQQVARQTAELTQVNASLKAEIEQRRKTEEALRQSERHFRILFETLPIPAFTKDREGRYTSCNSENRKYWTVDPVGYLDAELMDQEAAAALRESDRQVMESGRMRIAEEYLPDTPVGDRYVLSRKAPLRDGNGNTIGILGTSLDITEQRAAEQALKDSEERFRTLVEGSIQGILVHRGTKPLFVNPAFVRALGYKTVDEILALDSVVPLIAPHDRERLLGYHQARLHGEEVPNVYEYQALCKDGSIVDLFNTVTLVSWQGEPAVLSTTVDITKRKQAEEALRVSEARSNAIINSAMDAIVVFDETHTIVLFNPMAEKVFGYAAPEAVGQPVLTLFPQRYHQDYREKIRIVESAGAAARQMEQIIPYGLRADGTEFPMEGSLSQVMMNGKRLHTAILRDVTQRKELEEQIYQAQKMEAIGQLAGGVAHDFNNLLVPIMMYADLGILDLPSGHSVQDYLQEVKKAAEKARQLTQQILVLSRKNVLALEALHINNIVADMTKLLLRTIGENINLVTILSDDLPPVQGDANQLGQILMNLAINARDAMPSGGTLNIETDRIVLYEPLPGLPEAVPPGSYVLMEVVDTGYGMDTSTQRHLFEPFYMTKAPGQGTGLGLATVNSIVEQHKGHIQFESHLGEGTKFRIYLPVSLEGKPSAPAAERVSFEISAQTGTVLIVEDESAVRKPLVQILLLHGYHVLEATNGSEALRIAAAHEGEVDLLLTDMMMPDMNGYELRQRLIKMFPTMKSMYMSGYSGEIVERMTLTRDIDFLQKPFSIEQFIAKTQEMLG